MATFMAAEKRTVGQRSESDFGFKVHSLELSPDKGEMRERAE